MKLGISRPTNSMEEAREMLILAARQGFEGVQFKPNQYPNLDVTSFENEYGELAGLVRGGLIVYLIVFPTARAVQCGGTVSNLCSPRSEGSCRTGRASTEDCTTPLARVP